MRVVRVSNSCPECLSRVRARNLCLECMPGVACPESVSLGPPPVLTSRPYTTLEAHEHRRDPSCSDPSGIAQKDRERRAVREAREKEMAEQKEALQKTMEGVVSALKEAEQAVTEVHKTARGLPVEAKDRARAAPVRRSRGAKAALSREISLAVAIQWVAAMLWVAARVAHWRADRLDTLAPCSLSSLPSPPLLPSSSTPPSCGTFGGGSSADLR